MTEQAISQAEEAFTSMLNGREAPDAEKLLELFSQLEPNSADSMIGLWRVVAFGQAPRGSITVQPASDPLRECEGLGLRKLYGKRFVTRDDAEPIVCFGEDARRTWFTQAFVPRYLSRSLKDFRADIDMLASQRVNR